MQYNVSELLKGSTGASRRHEVNDDISGIDKELVVLAPLVGHVLFVRTVDGILVTGRLGTTLEVTCPRCLDLYPSNVEMELEEEFLPTVDIRTGASLPIVDDADRSVLINGRHILDLTEVIRQYLLIAQDTCGPCRPDCAGLCSECGQNLNLAQCQCNKVATDPRLEALKELL